MKFFSKTLFSFNQTKESKPSLPEMGLRAWRWSFKIEKFSKYFGIGFVKECSTEEDQFNNWFESEKYYMFCFSKYFNLGSGHLYYDGSHCAFYFGWLQFHYTGWPWNDYWCNKCAENNIEKNKRIFGKIGCN